MVLLKDTTGIEITMFARVFTFQYGSIKGLPCLFTSPLLSPFTFQYGSIKGVAMWQS